MARHYRVDLARNSRISTEITGYAVSTFCYLHGQTGEAAYRDAALRAGRFLIAQAWDKDSGIFPFEWPKTAKPEENRAFFFDCGIIVRGLIALWRMTNNSQFLDVAVSCGHGMAGRFKGLAPILQLPDAEPLPFGGSWSNNPGCYQLKSALGWFEIWREAGDPVFRGPFEDALKQALDNDDAFLPGTEERHRVMDRLHAYCYYLEALLAVSDREECAARIRAGIGKVSRYLRNIAPQFARSDVYAQLLRVRLLAVHQGVCALNVEEAREEAEAIPAFQWISRDPKLDGAFCFGTHGHEWLPYANPVSTAFCLQALAMWHARQSGELPGTWRDLI
ncbi:MAG TPA: hypothetical protein VM120_01975 [Bryobacteraceae bacterium]|nr:hypothetical protein [Bryobacteraceae bacterium]